MDLETGCLLSKTAKSKYCPRYETPLDCTNTFENLSGFFKQAGKEAGVFFGKMLNKG